MKPTHLLLPAAALAASVFWIGGQRREITALEHRNTILRREIAAARSAGETNADSFSRADKSGKSKRHDWKKIAGDLADPDQGSGVRYLRNLTRLRQWAGEMGEEELLAALDEINAFDAPPETRVTMEYHLVEPLVRKNPQIVLERFSDRLRDGSPITRFLTDAFGAWLEKDPAAARSWMDTRIAEGAFESRTLGGKSVPRIGLEGKLIGFLLSSDPPAAATRIEAIPPGQRKDLFSRMGSGIKEEAWKAHAELIRRFLPENEREKFIADKAFGNDSYLDRIEATPGERKATVEETAKRRFQQNPHGENFRADLEKLRSWAESTSPGSANSATGNALASSLYNDDRPTSFSDKAAIAGEYHAAGGGDDLLLPLLGHWRALTPENKAEARKIAEKLSDPELRAKYLTLLR